MNLAIVVCEDDIEMESENINNKVNRKQPLGGYMYYYKTECQRMKEAGNYNIGSKHEVLEKWKSMSDAEKEPYVTRSKKDRQQYKAWRKEHEKKEVSTRCSIKRLNFIIEHLKEKNKVYMLEEMGFESLIRGRNQAYLKGCIAILEFVLFDFWSDCASVSSFQRTGVARIRAWVNEEVVRVMVKLKLERPSKLERPKEEEIIVGGLWSGHFKIEEATETLKGKVGGKIDGVVKEVVELRGEFKGTPEIVIDANVDSECPAPMKKKQKVEKVKIPKEIGAFESGMCEYIWNSVLPSSGILIELGYQYATVSNVASLKPMAWVSGVVIDLVGWVLVNDSKKIPGKHNIDYIPYNLANMALEQMASIDHVASFRECILRDYSKLTDCDTTNWYMLVLDKVYYVATVYDSLFTTPMDKKRVQDARKLMIVLDKYNKEDIFVNACGQLKVPLKDFKFVEHKMNVQLNRHDYGIYVIIWMEEIVARGSTDNLVVGD
ncbi:hypothetical protein F3Y22_tig00003507pilonHSYRG00165 [Hibiscus syriacus]|uniref:HMG box domain-containing protein n=1 Tax=Hibiscus syriacus TaxID=106335 RepID=A0A6A3CR12_HIBSY|nr:hypothetical protein F3Y22_tig00003507pilonHSYRG00165 [Hibiscus syriacus]